MRIRLNGKTYPLANPVELSLRDLISLEQVTTDLGMPINLGILEAKQAELEAIKAPTRVERDRIVGQNPYAQMMFAVNLFASLRKAGEPVTFDQCLDLSPAQVEWIPDEGDDVTPDPTRRSPRKVSGAAVKRPTDRAKRQPPKASKKASTAA